MVLACYILKIEQAAQGSSCHGLFNKLKRYNMTAGDSCALFVNPRLFLALRGGYPRQLIIDNADEALEGLGARDHPAVDEECRSAGYAYAIPFLDIFLNSGLIFSAIEAGLKGSRVQSQLLGKAFKDFRPGLRRAGKELVMIGPKFPLLVGAAGRLMSFSRPGMQAVDWEVAKDKLYFLTILGLELGQCGKHPSAKWAIKVRELDDGDRRFRRSFKRSPVHRHLDPQHRRRLQVNHDLSL